MTMKTSNKKYKRAFSLLSSNTFKSRINSLEHEFEFGFALLIRFVQLEASLKILRYWHDTKSGWPDKLTFLNANWKPLRDLKSEDHFKYNLVIGVGGNSLREIRNRIAHEGHNIDKMEYNSLSELTEWALTRLRDRLPPESQIPSKVARVSKRRA